MPPPYGLLLVAGAQTHQENYARAFAADPRCRLVGLTDEPGVSLRRAALNLQLAAELGTPFLDNLDAALARSDVHLVSICAEPERRGPLAERAARAAKHVYLDKEPAASLAGARAVSSAVREANVRSQTFTLVRSDWARRARDVIASGRLGTLVGLHCEMFFAKGISGSADLSKPRAEHPDVPRLTFLDSKRELLCVGWYPLAMFQWLLGRRARSVAATTSNYFFANHQANGVEDFASLLIDYGGVEATIVVGRSGWSSHPGHGVQQLHLVGTQGTFAVDAWTPRLETFSDAPTWKPPATPHPEDPMGFWTSTNRQAGIGPKLEWRPVESATTSDAAYFLDCIEAGRESDAPAELAVDVLATVFAAYRSAYTGSWADVEG